MNAPFQIIISFRYIPRVGFLDHMVALLLIFIRKFHNVCTVVVVIVAVHLLSPVRLFMTSWTAAHQASLSFTICQSLLKFMSIESMMPSDHFILFIPFSSCPQSFCSIRVFSNESALPIRWPKYWSFSFSIRLSSEYWGLISFRIDWFDLLVVQGILKSLQKHHNLKASFLWCSDFFRVHLSHLYTTTGKNIPLTIRTFINKVMSLLLNTVALSVYIPTNKGFPFHQNLLCVDFLMMAILIGVR